MATAALVEGFLEAVVVDEHELAIGQLGGQRGAHSQLDLLVVHTLSVGTGLGGEDNATVTPLGSTDGTLAGTAGALLAPRLLAATGNLRATLSRLGALTPRGHLALDDVVHNVDVRLDAVHLSGELGLGDLLALAVFTSNFAIKCSPWYDAGLNGLGP